MFKCDLMGHSRINMEDSSTEGDFNCEGLAQEVSEEQNVSMLPRDCSCDTLVWNVASFCPLRSLPEAKVKRVKLIVLTKEVSN